MKRFDEFMQYKGLNDNQVTVQCSLSKGLLGRARKGLSDLGTNTIIKLANVYGDLNETWLLTGEGETLRCVSVNQDYDPYDIPKSEVRAMYVVLGCLHLE